MATWQQMQHAAHNGTLDGKDLPVLLEYQRELDRLTIVTDPILRKVLDNLRPRVAALIKLRGAEADHKATAETEAKRHDEKITVEREGVEIGKEALAISKEANKISLQANKISLDSNVISNSANTISQKANTLSRWALFVSGIAFLCSLGQLIFTWRDKPTQPNPSLTPATAQQTQAIPILPVRAVQTSNRTSRGLTNRSMVIPQGTSTGTNKP